VFAGLLGSGRGYRLVHLAGAQTELAPAAGDGGALVPYRTWVQVAVSNLTTIASVPRWVQLLQRPWRCHTALDSEGSSVGRINRSSFVRCRIARVSFSPAMATESVHTGPTRTATTATGSPCASHARS